MTSGSCLHPFRVSVLHATMDTRPDNATVLPLDNFNVPPLLLLSLRLPYCHRPVPISTIHSQRRLRIDLFFFSLFFFRPRRISSKHFVRPRILKYLLGCPGKNNIIFVPFFENRYRLDIHPLPFSLENSIYPTSKNSNYPSSSSSLFPERREEGRKKWPVREYVRNERREKRVTG